MFELSLHTAPRPVIGVPPAHHDLPLFVVICGTAVGQRSKQPIWAVIKPGALQSRQRTQGDSVGCQRAGFGMPPR